MTFLFHSMSRKSNWLQISVWNEAYALKEVPLELIKIMGE